MDKQWVLRGEIPDEISKELESQPELIRRVLFYRGVRTKEEAEKFLNPDYQKGQHDPFGILNMDKAVERILRAVNGGEHIIIFGDYDADGVCASVIFHDFFKKIGFDNFHVHIPDRHLDGYGLTMGAIEEFIERKAGLIITLDCGIADYEEVEKANSAGIDVVIVDHHLPQEKTPRAHAIVDPKQKDDSYPFEYLSGTGVAFKTIQALIKKGNFNIVPGWEKWLLDLVALATIADMVPLTDENRVLTRYGLMVLRKTQRPGLLAFFRRMDINPKNLAEDDVAFMIAPRVNIASRMDHANASFAILTTQSPEEANMVSGHLEKLNTDRKKIVEDIMNEIGERIGETGAPEVIVEGDMDWAPGVLGIAANRLLDKYERPVFLWGKANAKEIKGSCRSGGSVNLVDLMNSLPEGFLIESGGHAFAGGFSAEEGKIGELPKEILSAYEKMPKEETKNGILNIDMEMGIDDVNWRAWELIEKMQPFGMDNPKPVFKFSGLKIDNVRKFGNGGIHLGLDFKNSSGKKIPAIGFFVGDSEKFDLKAGQKIDLAATLEKSFFAGRTELRLKIVDIKRKK
ncbi:MAG: single-stranded-DNA-specific exonuclease RecJ [bacterium]|nr:single-stranded-DNA-specific exonuclease RecJ [bacterium]